MLVILNITSSNNATGEFKPDNDSANILASSVIYIGLRFLVAIGFVCCIQEICHKGFIHHNHVGRLEAQMRISPFCIDCNSNCKYNRNLSAYYYAVNDEASIDGIEQLS